MACAEDRKNVRKFLEDLLDEGEYQRVRRHVEACESCEQFVRAAGSVSSMLMELGRLSAPDDLPDTVVHRYGVKRRGAVTTAAASTAPAEAGSGRAPANRAASVPGSGPVWVKIIVVLLVLLTAGLAWRDWVQTRLLEALLQKNVPAAAPVQPSASAVPVSGDFRWGNVRVEWPSAARESLLEQLRGLDAEIRYEAPGVVAARVPAARDAEWRDRLRQNPEATIRSETASTDASGDRLYSIAYGEP